MKKSLRIVLQGKIRGQALRSRIMHKAVLEHLTGMVTYRGADSLLIEVEGGSEEISRFLSWCRSELAMENALSMDVFPGDIKGFSCFSMSRQDEEQVDARPHFRRISRLLHLLKRYPQ